MFNFRQRFLRATSEIPNASAILTIGEDQTFEKSSSRESWSRFNRWVSVMGKDGVAIPIPTHFFKVVVARVDGKRVAVGVLIPHRADLGVKDLEKFVVPVRIIESVKGINFMAELGAYKGLEMRADGTWFEKAAATFRL